VVLDETTFEPLARVESPYDPGSAGGPRFVGVDSVPLGTTRARLALFHSTGFVRGIDIRKTAALAVEPAHPDLGIDADLEEHAVVLGTDFIVALDPPNVRLVAPHRASGRSAFLTMDTAPPIQGLRPVGTARRADEVVVLYVAAGQLYPRVIKKAD